MITRIVTALKVKQQGLNNNVNEDDDVIDEEKDDDDYDYDDDDDDDENTSFNKICREDFILFLRIR